MTSIGDRLKELQDRAGLKAVDVCNEVGILKNTYSQWINNKRVPDLQEVIKITDFYKPTLGDQTLYVFTGKSVNEYMSEILGEYKKDLISIDQLSIILHQSLEDLEELGVIKFAGKAAINQSIKLILNRSKKLGSR